jgi:hypothetical protein
VSKDCFSCSFFPDEGGKLTLPATWGAEPQCAGIGEFESSVLYDENLVLLTLKTQAAIGPSMVNGSARWNWAHQDWHQECNAQSYFTGVPANSTCPECDLALTLDFEDPTFEDGCDWFEGEYFGKPLPAHMSAMGFSREWTHRGQHHERVLWAQFQDDDWVPIGQAELVVEGGEQRFSFSLSLGAHYAG